MRGAGELRAGFWAEARTLVRPGSGPGSGEEGFLLIGALIAVFLVLLVLSIAAPTVAKELRREREVEAVHRGDEYVRAIQLYYRKTGHYPGSIEQLEKTNNIRFLREKYVDPMTGKADWRLIHQGEQKTTVKGFFGQPLAGVPTANLGSAAGMSSGIGGSTVGGSGSGLGSSGSGTSVGGAGGSFGASAGGLGWAGGGLGSASSGTGAGGTVADGGTSSGAGSSGISSQSGTSFTGSGAPIVGVGSSAGGDSIVVLNEQTTHPTWEFIYDPRIEALKAKSNLLGGGMAAGSGTGFGGGNSLGGSSTSPTGPAGSSSPMGSTSPFGSSSPTSPTPSTTTTPQ